MTEEIIRFDGSLNQDDANVPNGDYADARNITKVTDDAGNGKSIKKLRSISEFSDISPFGTPVATTIDQNGNQYILCHNETATITHYDVGSAPSGAANGDPVTQSNGLTGFLCYGWEGTTDVYVYVTSGTPTTSVTLNSTEWGGSVSVNSVTSGSRNIITMLKVDTSGAISIVFWCEPLSSPTITDPSLVLLGDVLVSNYLGGGIPISFHTNGVVHFFQEGTLDEEQIDIANLYFIKAPPVNISVTPQISGSGDKQVFSNTTYDFACRYVYDSGEVSVLSPYVTVLAEDDLSELNQGLDGIDSVSLAVSGTQPQFVSKVQWYARANGGVWRRISTNTTGTVTFTGQLGEALSTDDSSSVFHSIPITAETIEVIKNRVFTGNIVDDLPAHNGAFNTMTLTGNSAEDDYDPGDANSANDPYSWMEDGSGNETIDDEVSGGTAGADGGYLGKRGALTNDSLYKVGVVWMDEFGRHRGVDPTSIKEFRTGNFDFPTRIKTISFTSVSPIPSWAKWAQVVATKNISKDFSIEGYASGIFFEIKDENKESYFSNFAPSGSVVESVVINIDLSYTFQKGDMVNLKLSDGTIGKLNIKSVVDGLIYCDPNPSLRVQFLGAENNYIEIFSPRAQNNDEGLVFYGTSEIVSASTINGSSITDPDIHDQTFIKEKTFYPVFKTCIDSDLPYHFEGDSVPTEQEGFPSLIQNGALVYFRNNYTNSALGVVAGVSTNVVPFDGLHTKDPKKAYANAYWGNHSHGHSVGDVVVIEGGTYYERVVRRIDASNYIAVWDSLSMVVGSTTGFSSGDAVTITMRDGSLINGFVGKVSNSTIMAINSITLEDATHPQSLYLTVSNGTYTEYITSASYLIPVTQITASTTVYGLTTAGDHANRTLYSEDSLFVCGTGVNPSEEIHPYPLDIDELIPASGNPVYRFDNIYGVAIPAAAGTYRINYDFSVSTTSGNLGNVYIRIWHGDTYEAIATLPAGANQETYSGIIEYTHDGNGVVNVCIEAYANLFNEDITFYKGGYVYVENTDDQNTLTSLSNEYNEYYTLSRKPNKRISEDSSWDRHSGKPSVQDTQIEATSFTNKFRWGGKYIDDASTNPISSFYAQNQETVPHESGAITALVRTSKQSDIGSVLLALCINQTNSVYVGERMVTNNDGSQQLLASDSVVGSVQPLIGNNGCQHRKSIAKDNKGSVVWWDGNNRDVCRYTREGVVTISDFGMKSFFTNETGGVVSFFDKLYNTFFFHFPASGNTISFCQERRSDGGIMGWVCFHDFSVGLGGEQFNERSFPIYNNKVFKTIGSTYGSYMGSNQDSYITLSFRQPVNFEPIYLRLEGGVDFSSYSIKEIDVKITNDAGQETNLDENFFEIDGAWIYSDIHGDENSPGGIAGGIPLFASNVSVKVLLLRTATDNSDPHAIRQVVLGNRVLTN